MEDGYIWKKISLVSAWCVNQLVSYYVLNAVSYDFKLFNGGITFHLKKMLKQLCYCRDEKSSAMKNFFCTFQLFTRHSFEAGAQWGYLRCSIRGTNNQLPNRFYKFVHLQLFNVKFLFSKNHVSDKQRRMVVYGRTSFFWVLKDDLLSPRHK